MDGQGVTASIEAGYPFQLGYGLSIEPQGQLIWQHFRFDQAADPFTTLAFDIDDTLVGRFGLRMAGNYIYATSRVQPYLQANVWHMFSGTDTAIFNAATSLGTPFGGTALEITGGLVAQFSQKLSVYASGGYTTNLGGRERQTLQGNLGLRAKW
jgi:autotransporter family porin